MRGGGASRRLVGRVWKACVGIVAACVVSLSVPAIGSGAQDGLELGPETSLGARVPSAAPGSQHSPAIAHGDGSSVAVWAEWPEGIGDETIVARHLDERGVPLDDAAHVVAPGGFSSIPDIAFGHGIYLVAFADVEGNVFAVRLDEAGRPIDETPMTVRSAPRAESAQVARIGDAFAVTWAEDDDEFSRLSQYGAIVEPDGDVGTPVRLVGGAAGSLVAGPPGELLVLWSDFSQTEAGIDAFGRRFDSMLQPIGERFAVSDARGTQEEPDAVFDGSGYLVAWSDDRSYPETQIRTASMTAEGAIGETRVAGTHRYFTGEIDVATTGTSYDVFWREVDGDTVHARRVAGDGTFTDPAPFVAYADEGDFGVAGYGFDVAGSPDGTLFVVEGFDRHLQDNVLSVRLAAGGGDPASPILVSRAANGQRSPAIAGAGKTALVVWQDWRTTAWQEHFDSGTPESAVDVYAARLTPSGLVPPRGMRISGGDQMEAHPAVAWTGRSFLAAWTDAERREIGLRSIARDGTLGRAHRLSGRGSSNAVPRLAGAGGRGYLVWFNEYEGSPSEPAIMRAPVNGRGGPAKPRILFEGDISGWDVAAVARRFTVAWLADDKLYTRTFSSRGIPLAPQRVVASTPGGADVRIGGGGGRLLVTWRANDVYSMVLDSRGRGVTEPRIVGSKPVSYADVLWDGDGFVVAWHERTGPDTHDLEAVEVDTSGAPGDRDAISLGRLFRTYTQLGVAVHDGVPIVVYERHAPEPLYGGVGRIFSRALR